MAKILIADDDHDIRELVSMFLIAAGHETVTVADGVAAFSKLTTDYYDLAVLDNAMPGMTGIEVLHACKPMRAPKPVMVVLSALASREDVRMGYIAGADDYIAKPFGRDELVDRVQMLLDERQLAAAAGRGAR